MCERRADVRREDDDAAAEVGRPALLVGQAAVVEDLEEEIPDRRRRLLELVEQDDGERVLPDGREQRRAAPFDARVREQAVERVRRLVLAHVQAHESPLGAEEELRERLRDLRLPRAGRADEEEDAERTGRVVEPGLDHRDALDDRLDGFRLREHPCLEEGPHLVQAQRGVRIEHRERQAGRRGERREHVGGLELGPAFLRHVRDRGLDESEKVARRRQARQELLRELEGLDERRPRGTTGDELLGRRHRGLLVERPDPDDLEGSRDSRPFGEQALERRRVDLADDGQLAALDRRQHRVEHPHGAPRVLAGVQRLAEAREEPHHGVTAEPPGEVLDASLQLADVDGARADLRRRSLERDQLRRQPLERSAKKRCLADAVLADEEERAPRLALQRVDDDLHELAAPAGKEGLWVVVRALKDAADVAQELEIDRAPAPPSKEPRKSSPRYVS